MKTPSEFTPYVAALALAATSAFAPSGLPSGSVVAWGRNDSGQINVPPNLDDVVAVAAGGRHAVVLKSDGTVVAWPDPAPALSGVRAIACGSAHSLALRSNGTVTGWGANDGGQCSPPASATSLASIAAGGEHSMGVRSNGTVVLWGREGGTEISQPPWNQIKLAALGLDHALGLKQDGTVLGFAWGPDMYGQATPPYGLSNVVSLATSYYFSLALRGDGTLRAWGGTDTGGAAIPNSLVHVLAISAGNTHNLALVADRAPVLVRQPTNVVAFTSQRVEFPTELWGADPLACQWQFEGSDLPGATNATLCLPAVQFTHAGHYRLVVSNAFGITTSQVARLTISEQAPFIVRQPASCSVYPGRPASFVVVADGSGPLAHQWRWRNAWIPGATNAGFTIRHAQPSDAGEYTVCIANLLGSVTSQVAQLTMRALPTGAGSLDVTFDVNANPFAYDDDPRYSPVNALTLDSAGRVYVAGRFVIGGAVQGPGLARLLPDGRWDQTYRPPWNAGWYGGSLALQPDQHLLVSGGTADDSRLNRLNPDGSLDATFHNNYWRGGPMLQPDGRILVGVGTRLFSNGSRDYSFSTPSLPSSDETYLSDVELLPDGGFLISGSSDIGLRKYFADGFQDFGFNSEGIWGARLCAQPDGRILAGRQGSVSRLNAWGGWDGSFTSVSLAGNPQTMAVQPDGRILVAMIRTEPNGAIILPCTVDLFRFHANGARDYSFSATLSGECFVHVTAMLVQPGGQILIGGNFSSVNGLAATNLARLNGDHVVPTLTRQPIGHVRFTGQSATFDVGVTGTQPFAFEWFFNGRAIDGATLPTFTVSNLTMADAGNYSVMVSNIAGVAVSFPAALTVLPLVTTPGSLDITFDPTGGGRFASFGGFPGRVNTVAEPPDGKLLIGGEFTAVDGVPRNNLARLNADWTVDRTFNPGLGPDGEVGSITVQSDDRVLISGSFVHVNAQPRRHVARLNADGSLDATFRCDLTGDGTVRAGLTLQDDGKIWVAGTFDQINGVARTNLARIHADGSVDPSFDPADRWDVSEPGVNVVALQPDGKVLVAGTYRDGGWPLVRLNVNGSLDAGFGQGGAPTLRGWIEAIAVQPDGRIVLGGDVGYGTNESDPHHPVVRLNANGTLDTGFVNDTGTSFYTIHGLARQSDGKLIVTGDFTSLFDVPCRGIARLNSDGTLDTNYHAAAYYPPPGATFIQDIVLRSDGQLVTAGGSSAFCSTLRLFQFNPDGILDTNAVVSIEQCQPDLRAITCQPDGRILVIGEFRWVNGRPRWGLARLLGNGQLDWNFDAGTNNWPEKPVIVLQPDGKIIVDGTRRLLSDGSPDPTFRAPSDVFGVDSVALQPDGRILIGGCFTSVGGFDYVGIARLNGDGTVDSSFQPVPLVVGTNRWWDGVNCILVQADGEIVLVGGFDSEDGSFRGLARLLADGRVDTNFNHGVRLEWPHAAVLQPDGKLIVSDPLALPVPPPYPLLLRLNRDGTIDPTFNAAQDCHARTLCLQTDGKLLVGCEYDQLIRLNADGSLDSAFTTEAGRLLAMTLQPDGQVLVSGEMRQVGVLPMHGLVRLNNEIHPRLEPAGRPDAQGFRLRLLSSAPRVYRIEASSDLTNWASLGNATNFTGTGEFLDQAAPSLPRRFYRARFAE